jgi:hypothetical protein
MRLAAVLSLHLCGCASLDPSACQQADWYTLGYRDAMYGLQRQDEVYATQCASHGVKIELARYVQGWREGKYEFDRRTSTSAD